MVQLPNWENIRILLNEGFGDEELRQLIFDTPVFKPVFNQLAANTGKAQIVQLLLEYADQQELAETLLAQAQERNPAKYELYQPYYFAAAALRQPPSRPGSPPSQTRPITQNRWLILGLVGVVGLIVLAALGGISVYLSGVLSTPPPTPTPGKMTGDIRIAVAGFVVDPAGDPTQGLELARSVAEKLQAKADQAGRDPKIVVWGPEKGIGSVTGRNEIEWQQSAQKIAAQVEAQVVVYGVIDAAQMVSPKFSLSPETFGAFTEVEEITGQAVMGVPQPLGRDIEQYSTSRQLATSVEIVWNVISGLFAYYVWEPPGYSAAMTSFQKAEIGWSGNQGKHVLYVLIGNTANRLKNYVLAEAYFKKALTQQPGYPQAYLGLGDVYRARLWPYMVENRPFDQDFEVWLEQAIDNYQKARAYATDSPPGGLAAKVEFGLGECYFSRGKYQNSEGDYRKARDYYQEVILDCVGDCPNRRLKEAVANAHARLGALYLVLDPKDQNCALKEYQRAVTMHSPLQPNFESIINQLKDSKADQSKCQPEAGSK